MQYGLRLAKYKKKFQQHRRYTEKHRQLNEQKDQEKEDILEDFFAGINRPLDYKTRLQEKNAQITKKKYYRQPKIYQNDYIKELYLKNMISEYLEEPDPFVAEFKVLYLFFVEKNETFLLLGRDAVPKEGAGSSSSAATESVAGGSLIADSDHDSDEERDEDDDSPYFVKITIDQWFLTHLEDPSVVDPSEVAGNYQVILSNPHFKEIIQREIETMFGPQKKAAPAAHSSKKSSEGPRSPKEKLSADFSDLSESSSSVSEQSTGKQRKKPKFADFEAKLMNVLTNYSQILNFK